MALTASAQIFGASNSPAPLQIAAPEVVAAASEPAAGASPPEAVVEGKSARPAPPLVNGADKQEKAAQVESGDKQPPVAVDLPRPVDKSGASTPPAAELPPAAAQAAAEPIVPAPIVPAPIVPAPVVPAPVAPAPVALTPTAALAPSVCLPIISIPFDLNSARLRTPGLDVAIAPLREWLAAHKDSVLSVEGHADSSGSERYNVLLSFARAQAVVTWLAHAGAPEAQLAPRAAGTRLPSHSASKVTTNRQVILQIEGVEACREDGAPAQNP